MPENKKKPTIKIRNKREIVDVPIDQIRVPDERITSVTPEEIIIELKDSIARHGILQPLQIIEIEKELVLVDGLHRIIAAQQMGKSTVPCIIRKGTAETLLVQNLIVNRQRGASDPVGEGIVLRTLVHEHGMNVKEACRTVGMSPSKGRKLYKIVNLSKPILAMITTKHLAVGSAEHLLALDDPEQALEVAHDAVKWNYTVEQTKSRVLELLNPDHSKPIGGYEFSEAGQPAPILPKCFACGKDIHDRLKLAYFCIEDYEMLRQLLEEMKTSEVSPPQPTPQPQQQQYIKPVFNPIVPSQSPPQPTFKEQAEQLNRLRTPPQNIETAQTAGVNMPQLQCQHRFEQSTGRSLYCPLCNLTVNY